MGHYCMLTNQSYCFTGDNMYSHIFIFLLSLSEIVTNGHLIGQFFVIKRKSTFYYYYYYSYWNQTPREECQNSCPLYCYKLINNCYCYFCFTFSCLFVIPYNNFRNYVVIPYVTLVFCICRKAFRDG